VSARAKVLVVGPSWVGDMVMAQALYRVLAARTPTPELHVLAPPWSLPLLARMPEVAKSIELAAGHGELKLGLRRSLGLSLRAEHYTEAIVLPRSLKAALVPWFARIPKRTGFRGEWRYGLLNDVRELDRERLDQTVKRFIALGLEANAELPGELPAEWRPRLRVDDANLARLRQEHGLGGEPIVALMPGAEYGPAKRWPAPSFAVLARSLAQAGRSVLLLGSAKERELGEEIRVPAGGARVRNLCGKTTLGDVVDLLAAADAAVSNDSGLLHVAAAAGAPLVAIYGSSSPTFTPPLTARATILYRGIECSPCFARECPLGHLRCLREIEPGDVLAAVEKALAAPRTRAAGAAGD
jgi:lipopolysaccharide heptosyltransferase II